MKITGLTKVLSAVALFGAISMNTQAAEIAYEGEVQVVTGLLAALIGPSPIAGSITYDDAAVAGGLAGIADITGITMNVGGFCFTLDPLTCVAPQAPVDITSIDSAAVTFAALEPTGGSLAVTAFIASFSVSVPIAFDLSAGTFLADAGALGQVTGTFAPAVVPVPAAAWLFGSALMGLAGISRKRKAA